MSKEDEEIKRRKQLFEDESDLVVERQSQNSLSILPVIIALFVIYLLFNLFSENKSVVQSFTNLI